MTGSHPGGATAASRPRLTVRPGWASANVKCICNVDHKYPEGPNDIKPCPLVLCFFVLLITALLARNDPAMCEALPHAHSTRAD